jgi:DNA-directed RNA polymerase specialized sigma24 family protein
MGSLCHPTVERRGKALLEGEIRLHERVVARDQEALLEWLHLIGGVVYSTALSYTGNAGAAEEKATALFLEVWLHPAMFHPTRGPLTLQLIRRLREDFAQSPRHVGVHTST